MFNPDLSIQQFLLLLTALVALFAGYQLHARVLPWLRAQWKRRRSGLRYFEPHPYLTHLAARNDTPPHRTDSHND